MYILDTNTLIYYFKGLGRVAENLLSHEPKEICIPTVVLYDLYVGIGKSNAPEKRSQQLSSLLADVNVLPFKQRSAEYAAQIRNTLENQGQPIGPLDVLIAGTALAQAGALVTHNTREFSRVTNLKLVDWY
ncbi:MAG: type II toxin-antitoxin system VapC family toxin [Leptolyngbyaceae cyanobacterium MO_188.B28]|nr:type II toxin-antitoxin system VapC family toxin [Leptolyngbyaceae cyanobacterium MO_188.B28]